MNKYRVTYTAGGETKDNGWTEPVKSATVEADDVSFGNHEYSKIVNEDGTLTVFFTRETQIWAVYTNVHVLKRLT